MRAIITLSFLYIIICSSALAEEASDPFSIFVYGKVSDYYAPQTQYQVNRLTKSEVETNDNTVMWGIGLDGSYRLSSDSLLSGSAFGEQPKIVASLSQLTGDSSASIDYNSQANNTFLGVDGTTSATRWLAGTWNSNLKFESIDASLSIEGTEDPSRWSFVPHAGFAFSMFESNYDLDRVRSTTGVVTNVLDGTIDSDMYGVAFGMNVRSPSINGWSYGVNSRISTLVASTDMTVIQDRESQQGLVPDTTVKDSSTSGVYIGRLGLFVEGKFNMISLLGEVYGTASYGMPYIDLTSREGENTTIGTDRGAYGYGGKISLKFSF